ncbi:hypothetical protein DFP95_10219 [Cohnella lupini]|uniref:Uncharacterized protein n=1 Tax=Cohnella lupini TaxID=1294267 RepID=A0A3D9IS45_9BACL|nr:hypothetical protein DFP95_10219 [Cohnella lupini]
MREDDEACDLLGRRDQFLAVFAMHHAESPTYGERGNHPDFIDFRLMKSTG